MSGDTKGMTIFGVVAMVAMAIAIVTGARGCAAYHIAQLEVAKTQTTITCVGPGCRADIRKEERY